VSLKHIFNKKLFEANSYENVSKEVESTDFVKEKVEYDKRYIPPLNYGNPAQFVRYGLAEFYYSDSIKKILNTYPYDGSKKEKIQWKNESSELELWMFENAYPRTNGFITISRNSWGNLENSQYLGYGKSDVDEFIYTKNSFTTGNIYSLDDNQHDNLAFDLNSGSTFEFWLKKDEFHSELTQKEAILDLFTTGTSKSDESYGRLVVSITGSEKPFIVTCKSGSDGFMEEEMGDFLIADGEWHHYAVVLKNTGSEINLKLYKDSVLNESKIVGTSISAVTGSKMLTIGALGTHPSVSNYYYENVVLPIGDVRFHYRMNERVESGVDYLEPVNGTEYTLEALYGATLETTSSDIEGSYNSLHFDSGTSPYNYVKQVNSESLFDVGTSSFSFAFWINFRGNYPATFEYIISKFLSFPCYYMYNNSNRLYWFIRDSGGGSISLSTTVAKDNDWHHVYVSVDRENDTRSLLIDLVGSYESPTSYGTNNYDNTFDFTLGARSRFSATANRFNGDLDEFTMFDRHLTLEEVTALYEIKPIFGDAGFGKFSGSIDEFRMWKIARNSKEIALNYNKEVYGGTNTDTSNTDLSVYYKFNEGDSGIDSIDSQILDYSGRLTNGIWEGYVTGSRSTESAIVLSSASFEEFKDPIVYSSSYLYQDTLDEYELKGKEYDALNHAAFYRTFPSWIQEEDEEGESYLLRKISQVVATYLDSLHLQMEMVPELQRANYISDDYKAFNYNKEILESYGFYINELFVDSEISEYLLAKTDTLIYEQELMNIKNIIYKNIFNNLVYLYKTKGTETSIRNLLRCIGIDEKLLKINFFTDNNTYELESNAGLTSVKRKYINFNTVDSFGATVFQSKKSGDNNSKGEITGSIRKITAEAEVLFPKKASVQSNFYFSTPFETSSIFGMKEVHEVDSNDELGSYCFNLSAIRNEVESNHVRFALSGSDLIPVLTSSLFYDVYDDSVWNFQVKISRNVDSSGDLLSDNGSLTFSGVNSLYGEVRNSFELTSSVDMSKWDEEYKKFYVGASLQNYTGNSDINSDVQIGSFRLWADLLTNDELVAHNLDVENYGRLNSSLGLQQIDDGMQQFFEHDAMFLHWEFDQVTGSDSGGGFTVEDLSSGSYENEYEDHFIKYQYHGLGSQFLSNEQVAKLEYIPVFKIKPPGIVSNLNTVEVKEEEDVVFTKNSRPSEMFMTVEKNMFQNISEEMLKMFATLQDFNNIIGSQTSFYQDKYNELNFLRARFFDKVHGDLDFEKFHNFYKWIDVAIYDAVRQMLPASMNIADSLRTVIENHILSRDKVEHIFLNFKDNKKEIESIIEPIDDDSVMGSKATILSGDLQKDGLNLMKNDKFEE